MFLLSYKQSRRQGQCFRNLLTVLLPFVVNKMDAEEDYLGVPSMDTAGGSKGRCFTPLPQTATSSGPMDKAGDLGDMTFCMANYVKEAMQVSSVNL
jgi:hypothetical protein